MTIHINIIIMHVKESKAVDEKQNDCNKLYIVRMLIYHKTGQVLFSYSFMEDYQHENIDFKCVFISHHISHLKQRIVYVFL
jgi:hypothetical protein